MEALKKQLIKNLKGYSFEELETLLNNQKEPEVRDAILTAMEIYHEERFFNWL